MQWIKRGFLTLLLLLTVPLASASEEAININTASVEQLSQLKGIGPSKADAIVKYRQQRGPFTKIDELVLVKGIGTSTVEKNRQRLIVSQQ